MISVLSRLEKGFINDLELLRVTRFVLRVNKTSDLADDTQLVTRNTNH
jgi:hypothetical protein